MKIYFNDNYAFGTLQKIITDMFLHDDVNSLSSFLNKLDKTLNDIRFKLSNIQYYTMNLNEESLIKDEIEKYRLFNQAFVRILLIHDFYLALSQREHAGDSIQKDIKYCIVQIHELFFFVRKELSIYSCNIPCETFLTKEEEEEEDKDKKNEESNS